MDAYKTKRISKVVTIHLLLTFLFFSLQSIQAAGKLGFLFAGDFWLKLFFFFQPQILLVNLFPSEYPKPPITPDHSFHLAAKITVAAFLVSIPVWSFCFSWMFISFKDWLNHFPVLGKRVF